MTEKAFGFYKHTVRNESDLPKLPSSELLSDSSHMSSLANKRFRDSDV